MSREEKIICRWNREFPVKSCARLFTCTRDRKVEKNFPREFSFPPSNILFFPGHYFSAGHGKGNLEPGKFYFHDTNKDVSKLSKRLLQSLNCEATYYILEQLHLN
jgi:hypothetical protein